MAVAFLERMVDVAFPFPLTVTVFFIRFFAFFIS
jgi:hypothetical protein